MGQYKAIGGGFLISILLGVFCAILIALLTYLAVMSMMSDMTQKDLPEQSQLVSLSVLLGILIPMTYFISLIMIPYYSYSWSYFHGKKECEEAHKKNVE